MEMVMMFCLASDATGVRNLGGCVDYYINTEALYAASPEALAHNPSQLRATCETTQKSGAV